MENITFNQPISCRLCSSPSHTSLFQKYGCTIVRCDTCGIIYVNPQPSKDFLASYYSEDFFKDTGGKHGFADYEAELESVQITFKDRINRLRKYKPNGKLLDLGCATGGFMELAADYWDVYGIEISAYACDIAKKNNLKVFNGSLEDSPFSREKFDVITVWDTIEHLHDPQDTVNRLAAITAPGGIIALSTGDVGSITAKISHRFWHLYNIPQHLFYFNRITITRMLEHAGFTIISIQHPPLHFTLDYLLFRLITFYHLDIILRAYNKIRRRRIFRQAVKLNLFDVMLVTAQKNSR